MPLRRMTTLPPCGQHHMDPGCNRERIPHPRTTASPLSVITFWWILSTFRKGFKKDLEVEDLYDALQEHRSNYLGDKLERLWNEELQQTSASNKEPSLLRVLVRCFGPAIMGLGLILVVNDLCFQMAQPLLLGRLIHYFSSNTDISQESALFYAAGVIVCSIINVFVKQLYMMAIFHVSMKISVGLCSLLYRKALRLSKTALRKTTVGQAVNLLSNDVSRFDRSLLFFVYLWFGPLQTIIIAYCMWCEIGYSALIGVASILLIIPFQALLGKRLSSLRLRTAKRTDERIRFMNEILVGIQVIKMYAWEKPFAHLVSLARKREIGVIKAALYIRGFLLSSVQFSTKISIFISMVVYVLIGNQVTAKKMFVVTAYFNILKLTMTDIFPETIAHMSEAAVSVERIQMFLLYDEVATGTRIPIKNGKATVTVNGKDKSLGNREKMGVIKKGAVKVKLHTTDKDNNNMKAIKITKVTAKWTEGLPEKSLTDVRPGQLVAVIRHALGNEDKVEMINNGILKVKTSVVEDRTNVDPNLFKNGIRITNITAKWTKNLPKNTLAGVSLDVRPGGLVAVIGPVGSGKTSLFHAILKELPLSSGSILVGGSISYASQEPWLFTGSVRQNILFGQPVDKNRYRQVVRACALERDFQLLPHGDKTIVGERGATLSGGQKARINLARAVYKDADLYLLDDPLSAVDTQVGCLLFHECICGFLQGKTRVLVTHQLQYLETVDSIVIFNNGEVESTGTFTELQNSGLPFAKQLWSEVEKAGSTTAVKGKGSEIYEAREQMLQRITSQMFHQSSSAGTEPERVAEMQTRGSVSSDIYQAYCTAVGNCCSSLLVFGVCVLAQIAISGGDYWMAYWTKVEEQRILMNQVTGDNALNRTESTVNISTAAFPSNANTESWIWLPDKETCIYVYTGLIIAIVALALGSTICLFTMCMRASVRLHNTMFASITRATMGFFNNNPSGQILNRFSKDMGSIDELLPQTIIDCVQRGLALLGVVTVVALVNVWLLIPTVLMLILFYLLRVYYVTTSRSIKRLEGITRSPVFSHLSASLQGLTTIRCFATQSLLVKEFDNHQDLHSTSWYLFVASNRAFGLWLDCICLVYIVLVTFSFLMLGKEQFGGDVGLAITQVIGLTGMLQFGIRQSAEMENQMTAVERVLEYTEVEKEPPLESTAIRKPQADWPSKGEIVFNRVFLAYSKDEQPVLKNVSFTISPAEKVGIVGRTGAGKSSLITALFRLVDLSHGSILLDGVDVTSLGLHDLRSKISIIPQEPVLFSGLLRENLDPFDQYPDAALWAALAEVELKRVVDELPAGLSHKVSEGGSNFSMGQRQLLCLARAIIRSNKILVLDEATANVDPQTDELIQATIRRKFADCTVLTIAHRLHTVMDNNRIIVMDAGSVVEIDYPHMLLKNKNSYLYQMVQQTGHAMAELLFQMGNEKRKSD